MIGKHYSFSFYTPKTGWKHKQNKSVFGIMRSARKYWKEHGLRPSIHEISADGADRERNDLAERAYSDREILS